MKKNSCLNAIRSKISMRKGMIVCARNVEKRVHEIYNSQFKEKLDLQNPISINEKLQYLKLYEYSNNKIITRCVDKLQVKDYVKDEKKGICKTAKLLGAYENAKSIEWDKLPNQFVLKCNHGCGYNIICKDKEHFDIKKASKKLNKWLKTEYWTIFAEPQYRNVEKKILVEEYLGDDILTYTFWCFNGVVKVINIQSDSVDHSELFIDYFDVDWNWLDITSGSHRHNPQKLEKPQKLEEMINISNEFSKEFPFVRVDFYYVNNDIYLSELTFVPGGGYFHLKPDRVAYEWGKWLTI